MKSNGDAITLAASLMMVLQLHKFFADNILKHPDKRNYKGILQKVFFLAVMFYIFATTIGSFDNIDIM